MQFRNGLLIGSFVVILSAGSSFGAESIQGWMKSEGVTGRPDSIPLKWDREIIYAGPVDGDGPTAGMRMLAFEPGWFLLKAPGNFPAGKYSLFSINMGSIDGGSVGFEIGPTIEIASGTGEIKDVQFRVKPHYTVMWGRGFDGWNKPPWENVWGTDFYQTFKATSDSVLRVSTKLSDKNAGPGTHHLSMTLNFALYETNEGAPSTWKAISPTRTRFLAGTNDPIIHILDVNYLSSEVKLKVGSEYAVRFWLAPDSECTRFAIVGRTDKDDGYADGKAYVGDEARPDIDLFGCVEDSAPGTVVNYCPIDQEKYSSTPRLGSAAKYGQTFKATGNGLAGVEVLYGIGCAPNPSFPIKITLRDGVGGKAIGPTRTSHTVTDMCQGRGAAFWPAGQTPLTPGKTYYIEFEPPADLPIDPWSMDVDVPGVCAYKDGIASGTADMSLLIAEYKGK